VAQRNGFFDAFLSGAATFDPALRQGVQDADFNGTPATTAADPIAQDAAPVLALRSFEPEQEVQVWM
jgi:hypothetical protein